MWGGSYGQSDGAQAEETGALRQTGGRRETSKGHQEVSGQGDSSTADCDHGDGSQGMKEQGRLGAQAELQIGDAGREVDSGAVDSADVQGMRVAAACLAVLAEVVAVQAGGAKQGSEGEGKAAHEVQRSTVILLESNSGDGKALRESSVLADAAIAAACLATVVAWLSESGGGGSAGNEEGRGKNEEEEGGSEEEDEIEEDEEEEEEEEEEEDGNEGEKRRDGEEAGEGSGLAEGVSAGAVLTSDQPASQLSGSQVGVRVAETAEERAGREALIRLCREVKDVLFGAAANGGHPRDAFSVSVAAARRLVTAAAVGCCLSKEWEAEAEVDRGRGGMLVSDSTRAQAAHEGHPPCACPVLTTAAAACWVSSALQLAGRGDNAVTTRGGENIPADTGGECNDGNVGDVDAVAWLLHDLVRLSAQEWPQYADAAAMRDANSEVSASDRRTPNTSRSCGSLPVAARVSQALSLLLTQRHGRASGLLICTPGRKLRTALLLELLCFEAQGSGSNGDNGSSGIRSRDEQQLLGCFDADASEPRLLRLQLTGAGAPASAAAAIVEAVCGVATLGQAGRHGASLPRQPPPSSSSSAPVLVVSAGGTIASTTEVTAGIAAELLQPLVEALTLPAGASVSSSSSSSGGSGGSSSSSLSTATIVSADSAAVRHRALLLLLSCLAGTHLAPAKRRLAFAAARSDVLIETLTAWRVVRHMLRALQAGEGGSLAMGVSPAERVSVRARVSALQSKEKRPLVELTVSAVSAVMPAIWEALEHLTEGGREDEDEKEGGVAVTASSEAVIVSSVIQGEVEEQADGWLELVLAAVPLVACLEAQTAEAESEWGRGG